MAAYRITDKLEFPDPALADEDGLLAVGGDLSKERVLLAYSQGIFGYQDEGDEMKWWAPKKRFILRPARLHIGKSTRKFMNAHDLSITINEDFAGTVRRCRAIKRSYDDETWISDEVEQAYLPLHEKGFATSVEAYIDGERAGGLYGIEIGRCFFGESMYHELDNGSKIAVILLAQELEKKNYTMIDVQMDSPVFRSLGMEEVSFDEYRELLKEGGVTGEEYKML